MAHRRRNNEGDSERQREEPAGEFSGPSLEAEASSEAGREAYPRDMNREFERGREFARGREAGYGPEGRFGSQGSYGRESYGPSGMTGRESTYESGSEIGSGYTSGSYGGSPGTTYGGGGSWGPQGRDLGTGSERERWGGPRYGPQFGREAFGGNYSPPGAERFDREAFGGGYGPTTGIYGAEPGAWRAEAGPFRGRGPRGYQRSDERIHEDVCERLSQHGHIDASDIEVNVRSGEVTLTGTVEDRQMKRLAEDLSENVSGVRQVHNQIRIGAPQEQVRTEPRSEKPARSTRSHKSENRNR